jgi:hypothetical protein
MLVNGMGQGSNFLIIRQYQLRDVEWHSQCESNVQKVLNGVFMCASSTL